MSSPHREVSINHAPVSVEDGEEPNLALALQNIGAVRSALGHEPLAELSERPALYAIFKVSEVEVIRLLASGSPFSFFTRELQKSPEEVAALINSVAVKFGAKDELELRKFSIQFARNPEGFFPGRELALSRADILMQKAGELLAQANFLIEDTKRREGAISEIRIGKTVIVPVVKVENASMNAKKPIVSNDVNEKASKQTTHGELLIKISNLTRREQQVLGYADKGSTLTQIAERLGIHKDTVWNHLHNAKHKLGVEDIEQAVEWWNQLSSR
jgi:DNA-binding CsgD family transcriptional regulator